MDHKYKSKYLKYKDKYQTLKKLKGGYTLDEAGQSALNRKLLLLKNKYPEYYTDEILADYKIIIQAVKVLLDIPLEDDIIFDNEFIIDDNYFEIFDNELIDGEARHNIDYTGISNNCPNCPFIFPAITNRTFILPDILQTFIIGHEVSHIITENYLRKYYDSLLITGMQGGSKIPHLSQGREMICDLIGFALTFIAARLSEDIARGKNLTINQKRLFEMVTEDNMYPAWGEGSTTHPHTSIRVKYCNRLRDKLNDAITINPDLNININTRVGIITQSINDVFFDFFCEIYNKNKEEMSIMILTTLEIMPLPDPLPYPYQMR